MACRNMPQRGTLAFFRPRPTNPYTAGGLWVALTAAWSSSRVTGSLMPFSA